MSSKNKYDANAKGTMNLMAQEKPKKVTKCSQIELLNQTDSRGFGHSFSRWNNEMKTKKMRISKFEIKTKNEQEKRKRLRRRRNLSILDPKTEKTEILTKLKENQKLLS